MAGARRFQALRRRVHEVLEPGSHEPLARLVDWVLVGLVLVNVTAVVLESVPALAASHAPLFLVIEIVSILVFSLEYGLRLWCAPEHAPLQHLPPWRARLRYALKPQTLIDLVAIAPFYLALVFPADLRTLLMLRLLRFFKLARYSPGMASLAEAIRAERRALLASAIILAGTVLLAASAMRIAEQEAQPDRFGTIPDAMYWAVITLATVGYGDVVPVTPLGRLLAGITAVIGLVMVALPVGIIASAFSREIHRRDFVVTWTMVARVPIFADLDAAQVGEIMRYLRSQSCEPDEIIVRRGERAEAMYIIAAGAVSIDLVDGPVTLGVGQFFGEIAVLQHSERTATVRAVTRCKLLVLDANDLRHLMDRSPVMARRIRDVAALRGKEGRAHPGERRPAGEG